MDAHRLQKITRGHEINESALVRHFFTTFSWAFDTLIEELNPLSDVFKLTDFHPALCSMPGGLLAQHAGTLLRKFVNLHEFRPTDK